MLEDLEIEICYDEIEVPVEDGEMTSYTTLGQEKEWLGYFKRRVFHGGEGGDDLLKLVEKRRYYCSKASASAKEPALRMSFGRLERYAQALITYAHLRDEIIRDADLLD